MENLALSAEHLYNTVKKYAKPQVTPENVRLEQMARKLYDDFRGIINPRELERQATAIKEYLYHDMQKGCMLTSHCTELKTGYEKLRIGLRQFE